MIILDLAKDYLLMFKHFAAWFMTARSPKWTEGTKGDIVLVHGFNENWIFMKKIGDYLNSLGYRIHAPNYPTYRYVETGAAEIRKYILERNLAAPILIGHSKGGLISRYLLQSDFESKIKYIITVATPHHGTLLGYLGVASLHQLRLRSKLIGNMDIGTRNTDQIFNFYPRFDNHIIPNKSLILDGAKNKMINIAGHTRILESDELLENIKRVLMAHPEAHD